jgi:hypothetical protein
VSVQSNLKTVDRKGKYVPSNGTGALVYRSVYLFHKVLVLFYIPYECAFIKDPLIDTVLFDGYLDVLFLTEIMSTFFIPYLND